MQGVIRPKSKCEPKSGDGIHLEAPHFDFSSKQTALADSRQNRTVSTADVEHAHKQMNKRIDRAAVAVSQMIDDLVSSSSRWSHPVVFLDFLAC